MQKKLEKRTKIDKKIVKNQKRFAGYGIINAIVKTAKAMIHREETK